MNKSRTNAALIHKLIIAAVVMAFGALLVLAVMSGVNGGGLAALFSSGEKSAFPYVFEGQSATQLLFAGKGAELLSDGGVAMLDKNARELFSCKIDYTDITAAAADGRILIANRADGRYFLHNKKGVIYDGKLRRPITLAALGKRTAALASQSSSGEAALDVLDKDGGELFSWTSEQERIAALALSADGRYAAAALLSIDEGEIFNRVIVFDVRSGKLKGETELEPGAVLRLCFTKKKLLYVLTETKLYCLNTSCSKASSCAEFLAGSALRCAFSDGGRAALLLKAEDNTLTLKLFGENGALAWEKLCTELSALAAADKYTAVLQGGELIVYDKKGKKKASFTAPVGVIKQLLLADGALYVLSEKSVEQFTF
ncbi:MAG: DUF5711 family protein [Clostridium sp.]|jgi:tricorn protease-like protein|nr:DUF5711 family protein [Clostridium sp.]